jgi:hypothetical protein
LNNNTGLGNGLAIYAGNDAGAVCTLIGFLSPGGTALGNITQSLATVANNTTSDRRPKEHIVDTHYSIDDLMRIRVRDFNFIKDEKKTPTTGFIAQELFDIFPGAVTVATKADEYWSVDYGKLTPILVKAVQDQQQEITALEKDNAGLRAENDELKARLAKIEAKLGM